MAAAGGEETSWKGGDGFSGGGGNGEGKGGSGGENGGDGRFTSGGVGSGLQVELLSTHSFALSAGVGGESTWEHTGGGGGGGVLVNGRGPESSSQYCGQVNKMTTILTIELSVRVRHQKTPGLTHYPAANTLSNGWIVC